MTKAFIEPKELFSKRLQNVYICLRDGPCAYSDIISIASKKDVSFSHPARDVARCLSILEIMGIVKKRISGTSRIFELSDNNPDIVDIYEMSRGIDMLLDELRSEWLEKPVENLRAEMNSISEEIFYKILDLLVKNRKIKLENEKIVKNVTVYTHKKTSD